MKTLMSALVSGIVTLSLLGLMSITGCSSVKSAASALMPGEKKPEEKIKAGARLHLKVPPQVALMLFQDVASKNDWKVLNAGDQRDIILRHRGSPGRPCRLDRLACHPLAQHLAFGGPRKKPTPSSGAGSSELRSCQLGLFLDPNLYAER